MDRRENMPTVNGQPRQTSPRRNDRARLTSYRAAVSIPTRARERPRVRAKD